MSCGLSPHRRCFHNQTAVHRPDIKRRTLLAIRSLAALEPTIVAPMANKLLKRARDPHFEVAVIAIEVLGGAHSVK